MPRRRVSSARSARSSGTWRSASRRAGPTKRRRSRSLPAAAARSRTCGRSTTRSSSAPSWLTRCRSCAASVTRLTSRWPTSRPTSGRPPRRRPPRSSSRTGPSSSSRFATPVAGSTEPRPRACRTTAREVVAERRALDRLSPAAQLASARERVGLLLDRATRALGTDLAARRRRGRARQAPGADPARPARTRSRTSRALGRARFARRASHGGRRASLGSAGRPSAVLAPQATLDRGYAIVHRAGDGAIVRDPAEAPAGTRLALRVARGELPATADER